MECGLGHLVDFLDKQEIPFDAYRRIDVSRTMVDRASARLAERTDVALEVRDTTNDPLTPDDHDVGYIISVLGATRSAGSIGGERKGRTRSVRIDDVLVVAVSGCP